MDHSTLDDRLDELAPLAEPTRRALYRHVVGQDGLVGRDDAAAALGIGRALAAFHLDRLVEAGLLAAEYGRRSGRTGPGAGRPAKLYRRGPRLVEVSLPERRDDLLARLFADALDAERQGHSPAGPALDRAAQAFGAVVGATARRRAGARPSRARLVEAAIATLAGHGFEPVDRGGVVVLRNCPFDRVAPDHRDLVCGMNTTLMIGVIEGLGVKGIEARFDPLPGRCCVVLAPPTAHPPRLGA